MEYLPAEQAETIKERWLKNLLFPTRKVENETQLLY